MSSSPFAKQFTGLSFPSTLVKCWGKKWAQSSAASNCSISKDCYPVFASQTITYVEVGGELSGQKILVFLESLRNEVEAHLFDIYNCNLM